MAYPAQLYTGLTNYNNGITAMQTDRDSNDTERTDKATTDGQQATELNSLRAVVTGDPA